MRVADVSLLRYRGAVAGARSASGTWSEREGLLLRVVTTDGTVAQGEASPLPGYSPDALEDALATLHALDWAKIPDHDTGGDALEWLGRVATVTPGLPHSARFALETALLDALGQRIRQPMWTLLRPRVGTGRARDTGPVPLCALVGGADDVRVVESAVVALARGIRTVKLKIVGPSLEGQLETLRRLRDALGDAHLRLDANRTLAGPSAEDELAALVEMGPELVEEPVPTRELSGLPGSPVPLALDESLQDADAWDTLAPHFSRLGCVAVVLKPTALGGLSRCVALAERARAGGLAATVSHTFDGPVALAAAAHLALAVASRTRASGLDGHGALSAWPALEVPHVGPSTVLVADRPGLGLSPLPTSRASTAPSSSSGAS